MPAEARRRMGATTKPAKAAKAAKPAKAAKAEEVRRREAEMILVQLGDLGFPDETLSGIRRALDDFCQGWGSTSTHAFPDLGVTVLLQLSVQPHVTSFARVRGRPTQNC